jgi:LAGLIDADG-like domain
MLAPYHKLTPQQKQQIIEVFNNGMECQDISQHIGVSGRSVARVLSEASINTKRRNRYSLNEDYFDVIDSTKKAYLLGPVAADGCVTKHNYIAFESIDRELTEILSDELKYSGAMRVITPGVYKPHYRINFSSQKLASALNKYGVVTGRMSTGNYYFPKQSEYLAAYILGYFDGDGCAYANKDRSGGLVCIVGAWEFSYELARILNMGSVQEHQLKKVYYWRIFSYEHIEAFYRFVYREPDLGLQRKKQKIEQILGSYKRG